MKNFSFIFTSLLLLISCKQDVDNTSASNLPTSKYLLHVDEVQKMLEDEGVVIFEISKSKKYDEGHLPGAINLWRPDYENKTDYPFSGMRASKEQFAQLLGENGVKPTKKIVLYDTKGSVDAIRVLWILKLYGHENIHFMDGGKTAWSQAGYALTKDVPKVAKPALYTFPETTHNLFANMEDVQSAILDTNVILLDTREPEEYEGRPYIYKNKVYPFKKGAFVNGRIPTAVFLNWSDAVDLDGDHRIKSIKDLQYNFTKAGVTPDKSIITYCQSGVRSAHTTFVLTEILGYPDVRNYDGSWIEWSYHHVNGGKVETHQSINPIAFNKELETLNTKITSSK